MDEGTWTVSERWLYSWFNSEESTAQRNAYCFAISLQWKVPASYQLIVPTMIYLVLNRGRLLEITPQTELIVKQAEFCQSLLPLLSQTNHLTPAMPRGKVTLLSVLCELTSLCSLVQKHCRLTQMSVGSWLCEFVHSRIFGSKAMT